eukprot:TRINITY_DN2276_c0_g1_i1.p1 TRINITY_DN2276_c0_g1~~TRINITY_DN2276_c0_g1_i1.p1  ORF type:complete len:272 (-),score=64.64 TRINITY_DN2276_c0_g1_i1:133-912(-)
MAAPSFAGCNILVIDNVDALPIESLLEDSLIDEYSGGELGSFQIFESQTPDITFSTLPVSVGRCENETLAEQCLLRADTFLLCGETTRLSYLSYWCSTLSKYHTSQPIIFYISRKSAREEKERENRRNRERDRLLRIFSFISRGEERRRNETCSTFEELNLIPNWMLRTSPIKNIPSFPEIEKKLKRKVGKHQFVKLFKFNDEDILSETNGEIETQKFKLRETQKQILEEVAMEALKIQQQRGTLEHVQLCKTLELVED